MNIQGRGATKASNGLKTTISVFTASKINIETIVGDKDFEAVRKSLIPVHIEIVSAGKHDGHAERLIRKVKYCTRCDLDNMPYKKCQKLILVSSLEASITWLDLLPNKNRISKTLIPIAIVIGTPKINANHAILHPGSYLHCKIKARITNNMKTRSMESITLSRSNERVGRYAVSLKTDILLNSYQ